MPTTLLLAPSNFQTFLRSCSPSSNWSSSFWHEIYLNMNTRQAVYSLQDCWAHDLLGFCLALAFPMYVRQDIFPIFSCCLYNPHNRPDLPAYPSCLTATTIRTLTLCRNFYKVISFDGYILPYARHFNPWFVYFFTQFLKSTNVFSRIFFLKILALCMVSIQERFLIKWRAYGIIFLTSSNIKCWQKHVFACLRYFKVLTYIFL